MIYQLIMCRDGKSIFDLGTKIFDVKDVPLLFSLHHSNKIKMIKGESTAIYFNDIENVLYISTHPINELSRLIHSYCIALHRTFPNHLSDILGLVSSNIQQLRLFSSINAHTVTKTKSLDKSIRHSNEHLLATLVFTSHKYLFATLRAFYKRQSFNLSAADILIIQIVISRRSEGHKWIPVQLDSLVFLLITSEADIHYVHVSNKYDKFDDIMLIHNRCRNSFPSHLSHYNFKLENSLFGLFCHNTQAIPVYNERLLKLKFQKFNLKNKSDSFEQFMNYFTNEVAVKLILKVQGYIESKDRPLETCQVTAVIDDINYSCSGWCKGDRLYLISSYEKANLIEREKNFLLKQIESKEDLFLY
eukprot:NODE_27_length_33950_cov_0.349739.p10 type:complete len:360 gc:universal NODE_27_length_33950_cov_0.349739:31673-32752(+)